MPASAFIAKEELNVQLGTGITPRATTYFALFSAVPDGTTADALTKEITGTGYARIAYSADSSHWTAPSQPSGSGTPWQISNIFAIDWGNAGSAWGTVAAVGEFDAASSGNYLRCVVLGGNLTVTNGLHVFVPSGAYVIVKPTSQSSVSVVDVIMNSMQHSAGTPSSSLGIDGDFCIDTTNHLLYGPKTSGAWGSGYALQGPAGATGHGSTTTTGAPSLSGSDWQIPVSDGTAFNTGNWIFVNDGTNSIFGQIKSGGGTSTLTVDHTTQTVVGTVSSIANGTTVTWEGQKGATGAAGVNATLSYVQMSSPPFTISSGDAATHNLCNLTVSISSGQKAKLSYTINFKNGNTGTAGLRVLIMESATQIIPIPVTGSGADCVPTQATESQVFSYGDVVTPSAGSHTYTLQVSAALATPGFTIYNATLVAEIYS